MVLSNELLSGMSPDELEALADSKLAPASQTRLDDLLERNSSGGLTDDESGELDRLIAQVDQLTILKARARLTLSTQQTGAVAQ
jgi:hypothetical protein